MMIHCSKYGNHFAFNDVSYSPTLRWNRFRSSNDVVLYALTQTVSYFSIVAVETLIMTSILDRTSDQPVDR